MHSSPVLPLVLMLAPAPLRVESRTPRVRVLDAELAAVMTAGLRASPTLRRTVATLESSDVIVHIVRTPPDSERSPGALQFVVATRTYRFLRIRIRAGLSRRHTLSIGCSTALI